MEESRVCGPHSPFRQVIICQPSLLEFAEKLGMLMKHMKPVLLKLFMKHMKPVLPEVILVVRVAS